MVLGPYALTMYGELGSFERPVASGVNHVFRHYCMSASKPSVDGSDAGVGRKEVYIISYYRLVSG
jgi:hypothetical protein